MTVYGFKMLFVRLSMCEQDFDELNVAYYVVVVVV